MRAGTLDRRVLVQRRTSAPSDSGEPVETWVTAGAARWALKFPVSGDERYSTPGFAAKEQVEFRLRWSSDIADLQPLDRIVEPASDGDSPPVRSTYDILAVLEIGRRESLRVLTARQADVA